MVLVEVAFTVELTKDEARALKYMSEGYTLNQTACYMNVTTERMERILRDCKFAEPFDLVKYARMRMVSIKHVMKERAVPIPVDALYEPKIAVGGGQ